MLFLAEYNPFNASDALEALTTLLAPKDSQGKPIKYPLNIAQASSSHFRRSQPQTHDYHSLFVLCPQHTNRVMLFFLLVLFPEASEFLTHITS